MSGAAPDPALLALLDGGRRYGRYEVLRPLGRGGMGAVYLARLTMTGGFEKRFALKVAHPAFARDPAFARRFAAEARLAARIDHPNVCAVVDFGSAHGGHYLVMEYLQGDSLQDILRRADQGLPFDVACRIACDAARGIHAAHELRGDDGAFAGVVHRDLKPANLFVRDDGVTKVLDFGIARWDDPQGVERTGLGILRGSSGYMAPEQVAQGAIDRRVDVYALGVVLWECTVGRRLFRGKSAEETLRLMREARVPPPSGLRRDYPAALESLVLRCLAHDPGQRPATAAALADALESVLLGMGTLAGLGRVAAWVARSTGDTGPLDDDDAEASSGVVVAPVPSVPPVPPVLSVEPVPSVPPVSEAPTTRSAPATAVTREPALRVAVAAVVLAAAALAVALLAVTTRTPARGPALAPTVPPAARDLATPEARPPEARPPDDVVAGRDPREIPEASTAVTPRRERPRTARRTPVVERFGDVNVMAWPGSAEVSENGRVLGHTPIAHLRLPAGRHVFTLRPLDGGPTRSVSLVISPDTTAIVRERW